MPLCSAFQTAIGLLISTLAATSGAQVGASRTALATIVDGRGRSIVDIEVDDIVVRERGQTRDVLSVRVADYPIAVVVDNGRGAAGEFASIREAAARFIGRVGRRPIAIVQSDPVAAVATFEDDRGAALERLQQMTNGTSPGGVFDAVVTAARAIQADGSNFSAIVVISATPVSSVPNELLTPILDSGARVHAVLN